MKKTIIADFSENSLEQRGKLIEIDGVDASGLL